MSATRLFRVDPRLIHATLMNVWVPTTGARSVIVVDHAIASDPVQRTIMEMSAMGVVSVRFCDAPAAAEMVSTANPEHVTIVVFSNLEDVQVAVERGLPVDRLNIGHLPEAEGRSEIHPAVHLGPADFTTIDALIARGVEVSIQPLPVDKLTVIPGRTRPSSAPKSEAASSTLAEQEVRVVNERGLHLRAASQLSKMASSFTGNITVRSDGPWVSAKSLLGITTLAAACGSIVKVRVEGPDAPATLAAIVALFARGFGEGVDWQPEDA